MEAWCANRRFPNHSLETQAGLDEDSQEGSQHHSGMKPCGIDPSSRTSKTMKLWISKPTAKGVHVSSAIGLVFRADTVPLDTTGVLGGFRRATKYSVTGFKVHLLCNVSPLQPHRPVQLIPALLPRHIPLQEEPPLFISIEQHLRN